MRRKSSDFSKLFEIILAFNSKKSYYALLDLILKKPTELTNAGAGTLYMPTRFQTSYTPAKSRTCLTPLCGILRAAC